MMSGVPRRMRPSRQLFDGIAEEVIFIRLPPRLRLAIDETLQILLESLNPSQDESAAAAI
jgi:hypothetical protein